VPDAVGLPRGSTTWRSALWNSWLVGARAGAQPGGALMAAVPELRRMTRARWPARAPTPPIQAQRGVNKTSCGDPCSLLQHLVALTRRCAERWHRAAACVSALACNSTMPLPLAGRPLSRPVQTCACIPLTLSCWHFYAMLRSELCRQVEAMVPAQGGKLNRHARHRNHCVTKFGGAVCPGSRRMGRAVWPWLRRSDVAILWEHCRGAVDPLRYQLRHADAPRPLILITTRRLRNFRLHCWTVELHCWNAWSDSAWSK
jgi:hypothetical protein